MVCALDDGHCGKYETRLFLYTQKVFSTSRKFLSEFALSLFIYTYIPGIYHLYLVRVSFTSSRSFWVLVLAPD